MESSRHSSMSKRFKKISISHFFNQLIEKQFFHFLTGNMREINLNDNLTVVI